MFLYLAKAGGFTVDSYFALLVIDIELIIHPIVNQLEYYFIHVNSVFLFESKHGLVVEQKAERTLSTQITVEFVEHRAYIAHGSGCIVGECFNEYGNPVRAVAFVGYFFVFALIFSHRIFDSPLNIILRHVFALAGCDDGSQTGIIFGLRPASFYCYCDFFSQFGECTGHVTPSFELCSFAIFKCSSHCYCLNCLSEFGSEFIGYVFN